MLTANTDQKVLGYLGRGLSLELSAVQLYTTHARLCNTWGLVEPAKAFRQEATSELVHADQLIARMLALGVAPNASQLRPVKLGNNLSELLDVNIHFEQELVALYRNAVEHCARIGDFDSRMVFKDLLEEEQAHYDNLVKWQASMK